MFETIALFVLGLALLALGGDSLVKGAAGLAQRLGVSPLVVGLLLVGFGTSVPELVVNARAIAVGQPALALGNAVGSNIANIGLTLGLAALAAPLLVRWRALAPLLLVLLLATVAVIVLGVDGGLSRGDGAILLLAFVAVLGYALARSGREQAEVRAEIAAFANTRSDLGLNLVRIAIALALLYFGARWIVHGAPALGAALGMDSLLTGLLLVAIATALPEAVAAAVAARRGQGDLVLGHVVGASLCNLLLVLGGMAALGGVAIPASFLRFELPAAFAFALLLVPVLRGDLRIGRGEGAVLLLAFAAWVAFEGWLLRA